jgi:hypothetical protein
MIFGTYDDWKASAPEDDEEHRCIFCGEPLPVADGPLCGEECRKGLIEEAKNDAAWEQAERDLEDAAE